LKFIVEYIIRKDLWGLKMGMFIAESVSDEILRKSRNTRLIALDLDGTTLTREGLPGEPRIHLKRQFQTESML